MTSKPPTLDPSLETDIKAFNKNIATAAEEIIFKIFPAKMLQMQKIIDSMEEPTSSFNPSNPSTLADITVYPPPSSASPSEPPSKKRKGTNGDATVENSAASEKKQGPGGAVYPQIIHINKHLRELQLNNKKECEEIIFNCDKVKLWVNLTMPRIEDGDNFGVQIQEEVLNELSRAQESAYNLRDVARSSHVVRAKLCSKVIKYPGIEDYQFSLRDHDEKQLFNAKQHVYDMRNCYAVLFDIIQKNIQKIRAPKGNNSAGMY